MLKTINFRSRGDLGTWSPPLLFYMQSTVVKLLFSQLSGKLRVISTFTIQTVGHGKPCFRKSPNSLPYFLIPVLWLQLFFGVLFLEPSLVSWYQTWSYLLVRISPPTHNLTLGETPWMLLPEIIFNFIPCHVEPFLV